MGISRMGEIASLLTDSACAAQKVFANGELVDVVRKATPIAERA